MNRRHRVFSRAHLNQKHRCDGRRLHGEGSGHDWWHVYRVWKMAERIGREEGADLFVVELAAFLHDIADW